VTFKQQLQKTHR